MRVFDRFVTFIRKLLDSYIYPALHSRGFSKAEVASEGATGGVRDVSDQLVKQPPAAYFPSDCIVTENDLSNQVDTVLKHDFGDVNIQQREIQEAFRPKMLEGRTWNDSFEEAMLNYAKSKTLINQNDERSAKDCDTDSA